MSRWADAITEYKRALLRHHLKGVSVSSAARQLGLARTYVVRLKRNLDVEGPRGSQGQP